MRKKLASRDHHLQIRVDLLVRR